MSAVGFFTPPSGRLFPVGVSGWPVHMWEALVVGIIAAGVTPWIAYRKRSFDNSRSDRRSSLLAEVLLIAVILAGTVFASYLNGSRQGPFIVKGPDYLTVAHVGEDVVLNCSVVNSRQDGNLQIEWRNLDSGATILICGDAQKGPCQSSRAGTHLFEDQRAGGNLSIKLQGVKESDAGKYRCTVTSKGYSSDMVMELSIVAFGTKPSLSIMQLNDSSIVYICQSKGWYPEPGIIWKDSDGNNLVPLSTVTKATGKQDLYNVDIQYRATNGASPSVTCIIQNIQKNIKKVSTAHVVDFLPYAQFRVSDAEWSRMHGYSVSLTLDPDTANPWLILSEGATSVSDSHTRQQVAENAERFLVSHCVLASEGFTSGKHYWEVDVGHKDTWDLGLAAKTVNRKGKVKGVPGVGHWSLSHLSEMEYQAVDSPTRSLVLSENPTVLGVYLNYERGQVSFFDVGNQLHLYTFAVNFTETLYPFLCPGLYDWQKNTKPLRLRNPKA
ncbi:butyrophilin subfamily 1 member A1-like [Heterodontus francisci]|uniref:butyrophilin subfamily 1 member A1-like n=1 Tax=Heterodontus francisci TaxID=7792 RepID=UPI00355B5458